MKRDQARGRGRLQDHRVLAGFERLGFGRIARLADRGADVAVGIELGRVGEIAADPARTAPVIGAHGAGVIEQGRLLVGEVAVAVGHGGEALAVVEEARGDELVGLARRDRIGGDLGAVFRRNRGSRGIEGRARLVVLLADRRHEFRVFRRELGEVFGAAHDAFQRGIVELVDRGHADALAERHLHGQVGVADHAAGGDVVEREADVAVDRTGQRRRAFVGLGQGDDLVEDGLRFLFGEHTHVAAPMCGPDCVPDVLSRGCARC